MAKQTIRPAIFAVAQALLHNNTLVSRFDAAPMLAELGYSPREVSSAISEAQRELQSYCNGRRSLNAFDLFFEAFSDRKFRDYILNSKRYHSVLFQPRVAIAYSAASDASTSIASLAITQLQAFELYEQGLAESKVYPWLLTNCKAPLLYSLGFGAHIYHMQLDRPLFPSAIVEQLAKRKQNDKSEIAGLLTYLEYVWLGRRPKKQNSSFFGFATEALKAVYAGAYEAAFKLFDKLYKACNQESEIKNVFLLPELQYAYIITCAQINTPDVLKKLSVYINKTQKIVGYHQGSLLALSQILLHPGEAAYLSSLRYCSIPTPFNSIVKAMAWRHFEMEETKSSRMPTLEIPASAMMRFEAMSYLTMLASQKDELRRTFGDTGLLEAYENKEPWRLVVEGLMRVSAKISAAADVEVDEKMRLAFVIGYGYVNIYRQRRLKSGDWSRLVACRLADLSQVKAFDDYDRKFIELAQHHGTTYFDPKHALPELEGCDRVYLSDWSDTYPITVTRVEPMLKLERKGGGFSFTTNIFDKILKSAPGLVPSTHEQDKAGNYRLMTVTQPQLDFVRKLISVPLYPASAAPMLNTLLGVLSNTLGLKVENDNPLEAPKTVDATSRITLRLEPDGLICSLRAILRPVAEATELFIPGQGRQSQIVTDKALNPIEIRRNIALERENLKVLEDRLADIVDDYEGPATDGVMLNINELLAVLEFVRADGERFAVEWPEGKALSLVEPPEPRAWEMSLNSKGGWFEMEGEVRIDEATRLTVDALLTAAAESNGDYIRLDDSRFMRLTKSLRRRLQMLDALSRRNHGKREVSMFTAGLLDLDLGNGATIAADRALRELRERISASEAYEPEVPKGLHASLRPYQQDGFRWMSRLAKWGAGACLADDMGLGKTVQTIAFMLSVAADGASLVVVPASVVPNWLREIERFAPALKPKVLNAAADRRECIAGAGAFDVVIATYGLLPTVGELLAEREWPTVVLDEGHTIKNRSTKMSEAVMELRTKNRVILTGTPIQNRLSELWNLFRFLNPGLLGSYDSFREKFINPIEGSSDKEASRRLKRLVQPFLLRRTKAEVVDELPEREDVVIPVTLDAQEMAAYEHTRIRAKEALENTDRLTMNTLAEITRLRQAACDLRLVHPTVDNGDGSKLRAFLELASSIPGTENRMLVFSQFTSFLSLAREALDREGIPYLYLDGGTPLRERERLVEEFQRGDCPLFLISLRAGGLGINLTAANYVVLLDPWWNPAIEQQATDRAYRIGQTRSVTVYRLIARNTIEEKILRLHATKRNLADALLEGTGTSHALTPKELLELISN